MSPFDAGTFEESALAPKTLGEVVSDPILAVLLAARARVERGWAQCTFGTGDGPQCAWGALISAEHFDNAGPYKPAGNLLIDFLPPGATAGLMAFNDSKTTTKADVLSLFDRAIAARKAGA